MISVKHNSSEQQLTKTVINSAWLKFGSIVLILATVISLSVASDYLFFRELLSSSIIIFLISIIYILSSKK